MSAAPTDRGAELAIPPPPQPWGRTPEVRYGTVAAWCGLVRVPNTAGGEDSLPVQVIGARWVDGAVAAWRIRWEEHGEELVGFIAAERVQRLPPHVLPFRRSGAARQPRPL